MKLTVPAIQRPGQTNQNMQKCGKNGGIYILAKKLHKKKTETPFSKITLFVLMVLFFGSAQPSMACPPKKDAIRFPFRSSSGLFGYVNEARRVVIPCQYKEALPFINGMGAVKKGDYWGVIDTLGNMLVPNKYQLLELYSFDKHMVMVTGHATNAWYCFWKWRFLPNFNILSPGSSSPILGTAVVRTKWKTSVIGGSTLSSFNINSDTYVKGTPPYTLEFPRNSIVTQHPGLPLFFVANKKSRDTQSIKVYSSERKPKKILTISNVWCFLTDGSLLLSGKEKELSHVKFTATSKGYKPSVVATYHLVNEENFFPIIRTLKSVNSNDSLFVLYLPPYAWGKVPPPIVGRILPCDKSMNSIDLEKEKLQAIISTEGSGQINGYLWDGFLIQAEGELNTDTSKNHLPIFRIPEGTKVKEDNFYPSYNSPLLVLFKNKKYGLWNVNTQTQILPFIYEDLYQIAEGVYLYRVQADNRIESGLIRSDGTPITSRTYISLYDKQDGLIKATSYNPVTQAYENFYLLIATGEELRE